MITIHNHYKSGNCLKIVKIVHTYINNMYLNKSNEQIESFADRWGLVSLAKQGNEVTLICGGDIKSKVKREYVCKGIKVIELPTFIGMNNTTRILRGIVTELKKVDADVFHTHHYCSFIPEITAIIGGLRRIPVIITYHTTFHGLSGINGFLERAYSIAMQPFLPLYRKHLFISNYIKNSWHFSLIKEKNKEVIYNHFNNPPLLKTDLRKNHSVLFVGRITHLKGVDVLLKSFAKVKKEIKDATLTIVGEEEGLFGKKMRQLTKDLDIDQVVIFRGPLYHEKKWQQLYTHQILVIPSRGEGFGNIVIEGMLGKLAVVISNRGALPEATGGHALIFNQNNSQDLATDIIQLFNDDQFREKLIKDAYNYAVNYLIDDIGAKLEQIYIQVLK